MTGGSDEMPQSNVLGWVRSASRLIWRMGAGTGSMIHHAGSERMPGVDMCDASLVSVVVAYRVPFCRLLLPNHTVRVHAAGAATVILIAEISRELVPRAGDLRRSDPASS